MNRFGLSILPCVFAIIALQCTQPSQLVNTGGSEVVGKLVTVSNKPNPVNNATVFAYAIPGDTSQKVPADDTIPVATAVSDEKGEYSFKDLDIGYYNFFGIAVEGGDTLRSFHAKVHIDSFAPPKQPTYHMDVGTDTMHAPGKIKGRVLLEQGDNTPITCYIPGSSFISISDDTGAFTISSVPPGVYKLYYKDMTLRYEPAIDSGIVVKPDSVTVLAPKVLALSTAGAPPAPKGVTVSYDTVSGQVTLAWNKVNVADLKDYIVSRRGNGSGVFIPIDTVQKPDTFFIDPVYLNPSDTSGHTYFYELFSQDSGGDPSSHSNIVSIDVAPPSVLRTSIFFSSTNTHNDTAAIGDKISIIATYANQTTVVQTIDWSLGKPDSIVRSTNVAKLNGTDTLTMSWAQPGIKTIYVRSLDVANRTWTESKKIVIVQDMPIVKYLSPDTTIDYGGAVQCSIAVAHSFGLCTLSVDLNHDSKYDVRRLGLVFDTVFSTGLDTSWGKVKIRITDTHNNSIDTFFTVTIKPQLHTVWVSGDSLSVARRSLSTAVLNGTLYAIGGCWDKFSVGKAPTQLAYARVEAYDAQRDKWTLIDSLRNARYECVSAVVNGKIYVIGGRGNRGVYVNSIEEYDPSGSTTWTVYDTMLVSRAGSACCVIGNTLYVFGGKTGADSVMDSIYSYDFATKKWSGIGKMLQPRYDFQAVSMNGNAYILGGYSSDDDVLPLQSIEVFNPTIGQRTQLSTGQVNARCNFAASAVNGSIYVFGGISSSTNYDSILTSGSMYDPGSNYWTPIRSLQQARYCFSAEVINGRIYCVGGATGPFNQPVAEKSTLIYYP